MIVAVADAAEAAVSVAVSAAAAAVYFTMFISVVTRQTCINFNYYFCWFARS